MARARGTPAPDLELAVAVPRRGRGDQGALTYDVVPTPGPYGVLWSNTTLTAAGSPYMAASDLTIAPGVTLTIEPGVTMQ